MKWIGMVLRLRSLAYDYFWNENYAKYKELVRIAMEIQGAYEKTYNKPMFSECIGRSNVIR